MSDAVTVGPHALAPAEVVAVARGGTAVALSDEARTALETARGHVDALAALDDPVYGVSTGFGALATRHIPADLRASLQRSLIRSHAAGSGPEVEGEVTRAMMLLRLRTLVSGHTGVRPVVADTMAGMLNASITPLVREFGSLGCSGDLAALLRVADVATAMSVESLLATDRVFAPDVMALRPHPGQVASAANVRRLLDDSAIVDSHRTPDCTRVQDAYSLRCAPQVTGAARDVLAHAQTVATRELASAIDNPVVMTDGRVESNGNFHGAPLAYALDMLAIPVADIASMSERRTDRFLDVDRNQGLPAFLAHDPGVDSGHMIAPYTQAAVVAELKRLAVPASVDSIPSSAMQEDHVSMGWSAARKLRRALDGLARVLAIEVLTAARAIDLRAPLTPASGTGAVLAALRGVVSGPGPDRHLAPEIDAAVDLVRSGAVVRAAEAAIGRLE